MASQITELKSEKAMALKILTMTEIRKNKNKNKKAKFPISTYECLFRKFNRKII